MIGEFAPKLVSLTDDVLFADVWERTELAARDRAHHHRRTGRRWKQ
jgi:4-carboxymuconolactone decarboxylase